jgi:V/A-type H+-transporting ATPase subunit I
MFRRNLNLVLVYFGLSSMFFGFLVGEFFGIHFRKGVLDPVNDILLFLIISVLIGLVHMSIGILSKILTNIKDKKNLIHALSLLLVMWSAFSIYFQRDLVLNKILLGIGILGLLIIKKFEILKELSSVLVGAVSYMRIAILGLGHLIINRLLISSFSNLSGSLIEISLFLILFFIGSLIVLTFGVFVAAIQVLRLHWLEFYSQFFIGKGKKFEAFKHSVF